MNTNIIKVIILLVGSEISAGNRYWVYYNKCDNVIQVMNHYTVAAAPAA